MPTQRGKRKKPDNRREVRLSVYITPTLDKRITNNQQHIFDKYGSVNGWINAMAEAYLDKFEAKIQ